jgi:hypothetical protein
MFCRAADGLESFRQLNGDLCATAYSSKEAPNSVESLPRAELSKELDAKSSGRVGREEVKVKV